LVMT